MADTDIMAALADRLRGRSKASTSSNSSPHVVPSTPEFHSFTPSFRQDSALASLSSSSSAAPIAVPRSFTGNDGPSLFGSAEQLKTARMMSSDRGAIKPSDNAPSAYSRSSDSGSMASNSGRSLRALVSGPPPVASSSSVAPPIVAPHKRAVAAAQAVLTPSVSASAAPTSSAVTAPTPSDATALASMVSAATIEPAIPAPVPKSLVISIETSLTSAADTLNIELETPQPAESTTPAPVSINEPVSADTALTALQSALIMLNRLATSFITLQQDNVEIRRDLETLVEDRERRMYDVTSAEKTPYMLKYSCQDSSEGVVQAVPTMTSAHLVRRISLKLNIGPNKLPTVKVDGLPTSGMIGVPASKVTVTWEH